jgi:HEAT repeat protein
MARTDLTYLEVDDAQYTLASIRGIRDQDKQFIRPLLSNRDLGKRWAGAIVLGQTGDPAAVGTLTELLDQDIPLDRKEQIVKTMQEIQYLPTDVLDLLRKKQKAAASRGDWYAAWIMQYRDQPRWAQERTNAVNSPGSPREP